MVKLVRPWLPAARNQASFWSGGTMKTVTSISVSLSQGKSFGGSLLWVFGRYIESPGTSVIRSLQMYNVFWTYRGSPERNSTVTLIAETRSVQYDRSLRVLKRASQKSGSFALSSFIDPDQRISSKSFCHYHFVLVASFVLIFERICRGTLDLILFLSVKTNKSYLLLEMK